MVIVRVCSVMLVLRINPPAPHTRVKWLRNVCANIAIAIRHRSTMTSAFVQCVFACMYLVWQFTRHCKVSHYMPSCHAVCLLTNRRDVRRSVWNDEWMNAHEFEYSHFEIMRIFEEFTPALGAHFARVLFDRHFY